MANRYQIQFTQSAKEDLVAIVAYISNEIMEPEIAQEKYFKIKQAISALSDMPKRIPTVRDEELAIQGYRVQRVENYHVFFVVDDRQEVVNIVRILYARRDWMGLLRETSD